MKTNAVRLLDQWASAHGRAEPIAYELREYEVEPDDLSAESVAAKIGLPPEQVFKTLVVRGEGEQTDTGRVHRSSILLAVIPGNLSLDLKAIAKLSGHRRVETVPLKEVQPLTGYVRGGVTAIACKKPYPVYVDELMEIFDVISISGGLRGLQILMAPQDYIQVVEATVGPISQDKPPEKPDLEKA